MSRRDVVNVSGADARAYLHGQLAQDVAGLAVGDSRWALLLEPNGKVAALVRVSAQADDRFAIDVDQGFGGEVEARVNRFRIRVDVTTELAEGVAVDPSGLVGWWAAGREERTWADDIGSAGDEAADDQAIERCRVAAGWPAMGREIRPGVTLPSETGVVEVAVRFGKGCYPGQELVERMDARGATAPRRLVCLPADGYAVGDAVLDSAGSEVGTVTSVAGERALAIVGRAAAVGEVVGPHLVRE